MLLSIHPEVGLVRIGLHSPINSTPNRTVRTIHVMLNSPKITRKIRSSTEISSKGGLLVQNVPTAHDSSNRGVLRFETMKSSAKATAMPTRSQIAPGPEDGLTTRPEIHTNRTDLTLMVIDLLHRLSTKIKISPDDLLLGIELDMPTDTTNPDAGITTKTSFRSEIGLEDDPTTRPESGRKRTDPDIRMIENLFGNETSLDDRLLATIYTTRLAPIHRQNTNRNQKSIFVLLLDNRICRSCSPPNRPSLPDRSNRPSNQTKLNRSALRRTEATTC